MNTIQKILLGVMAVAVLVVGIATFSRGHALGDATVSNYPTWYYNGIVIGQSNSLLTNIISGNCDLEGASSVADRDTEVLTCAVSTARVGDHVFMSSDLGGTDGAGAFPIIGALVEVAGTVTVTEQNQTGGMATPDASAITGIHYLVFR